MSDRDALWTVLDRSLWQTSITPGPVRLPLNICETIPAAHTHSVSGTDVQLVFLL